MDFFVNPQDLTGWVRSKKSPDEAATQIMELIGDDREQDISETCKAIYEKEDENASNVLFGVLAKHNLAHIKKTTGVKEAMQKQAQTTSPESRQRNNWVRGNRNKFNRVVDGFNEGTPWRVDRDKFFNFTHYYTDAISFDEDPKNVYSGEAIWRMYIMDKFTGEYQNKEGKWVGGYINDRFYVFPDAGTPANPDVPRDGGNQMGLPPGVKTRMPRPHQYSTERRLEEARGNKTYDIESFASKTNSLVRISSVDPKRNENKIYNIFRDVLEMREAGIKYDTILEEVSKHYDASILGVAQIDKVAQDLAKKHQGIAYEVRTAAVNIIPNGTYVIVNPQGVQTKDGKILPKDTEVMASQIPNQYKIVYHPTLGNMENAVVEAYIQQGDVAAGGGDQEVGLIGDESPVVNETPEQLDTMADAMAQGDVNYAEAPEDFPMTEVAPKSASSQQY